MTQHRAINLALAIAAMLALSHIAALEAGAPTSMAELHAMEEARTDAMAAAHLQHQRDRAAAKACPGGLSEWLEPDAPGQAPSLVCHARRGNRPSADRPAASTLAAAQLPHSQTHSRSPAP